MDTYIADKGIKFEEIPDSYVIYISKKDFFEKGKTIYHIDRVLQETGDVVDNGFYEIYVNTEIDDKSDIAELMKIYSSPDLPENNKFPKTCAGIKNLKEGRTRKGAGKADGVKVFKDGKTICRRNCGRYSCVVGGGNH